MHQEVVQLDGIPEESRDQLAGLLAPVVGRAFGSITMSEEDMAALLLRDELLVTLSDDEGRPAAFLLASTIEVAGAQNLTWVSRVAVGADQQGRGAGKKLVSAAAVWRRNRWIGCVTQNPSMAGALAAVCTPPVWPVDEGYGTGEESKSIIGAVRRSIDLCRSVDDEGVVRAAYGRRLGEFVDGRTSPIHELLCSGRVSQAEGDAVVFAGRIRVDR